MSPILIIEDDEPTRILLAAVARRNHFRPQLCADGREALEHLPSGTWAAIILDLLLPEVDGVEVLRELGRTAPHLLERVVVVTAAARGQYADCEELRAVHCVLRKPFELTALEEQILQCSASTPLPAGGADAAQPPSMQ